MGRHGDSGNLSFVTHLGKEERDEGGAEDAKTLCDLRFFFFDLVRDHGPDRHAYERRPQHPAQHFRADGRRDPCTQRSSQSVVDHGGSQNTKDDGERFFEACRQDERKQLRLVADFSESNDTGRDQK